MLTVSNAANGPFFHCLSPVVCPLSVSESLRVCMYECVGVCVCVCVCERERERCIGVSQNSYFICSDSENNPFSLGN